VTISVRAISTAEHLGLLADLPAGGSCHASFLQTPAWAQVKAGWRGESIGIFDNADMIGAGLVLYRQVPKLKRYFAYLPEGPVVDWERPDIDQILAALRAHLVSARAFGARIGPMLVMRRWNADTIKQAVADPAVTRLSDVPPDEANPHAAALTDALRAAGWRPPAVAEDAGFVTGQPRFNFWLPVAGRSDDELLAGMNQLWRRNIKRAAKEGVEVTVGGREALAAFHPIYVETAHRDGFTPRPLDYFQTMIDVLNAERPDRMRVYLAHHDGDLVAGTTFVRVNDHAWYSYGASTAAKRDVRGSNAIQWQMIKDARDAGCSVYDLRGVTENVEADSHEIGLIQFKVGTGGAIVEYPGEWSLPINRLLYKGFDAYLARRG